MSLWWPDIVIGLILLLGAFRGFKRGFVAELTGAVGLFAALVAAFVYPGMWDVPLGDATHLGAGSAHVIGMLVFAAIAYGIVLFLGSLLSRVAKLPILGFFNAILGAAVGLGWSALFVWIVLFVALYFPLSKDLRNDLHRSALVQVFEQPNGSIDTYIKKSLPWFVKPFSNGIFGRHRV
jgi:membrane protein required for colicin V production